MTKEKIQQLLDKISDLRSAIQERIFGQQEVLDQLLITFISGGHALLEGVPGLAKTMMIRSLAEASAVQFRRIQFTPDLMPTDIIGTEILRTDSKTGDRNFQLTKGRSFPI